MSNPKVRSGSGPSARFVAVEIGVHAVRVAEVDRRGGQSHAGRHGSAPIPSGCWDRLGEERDRIAAAIREAMVSAGITCTSAITAVPRRMVTVKTAQLPHAEPNMVAGLISFEAQQYIPFALDEVVLAHEVVSGDSDDLMTVMIVAARRTLIADLIAVFDKAGLELLHISVSSLALAATVADAPVPMGLLQVDGLSIDLAVAVTGRVLFTRAGDVPGDGHAAEPAVVAAEVIRTAAAYRNEFHALPLDKLVVAACGAEVESLATAISSALAAPVGRMAIDDPSGVAPVPAGLAVLAADLAGRANLMPPERAEKRAAARRRVGALFGLASAALLAIVALIVGQRMMSARQAELARAVRENVRLARVEKALKPVRDAFKTADVERTALARGLRRDMPIVDVLKAISDAVPAGGKVYLTQLAVDRAGAVNIHGVTTVQDGPTQLMTKLQTAGVFAEVRLGYLGDAQSAAGPTGPAGLMARAKPGEKMTFLIACRFVALPDDAAKPPARQVDTRGGGL